MKKIIYIAYPIFLILIGLSSVYYLYMGQWKSYVWLFGAAELLLTISALMIFIVLCIKRNIWIASQGLFTVGVLCAMQLFPLVGAFFIYTSYFKNVIFHMLVIALGILLWRIFLLQGKKAK